MQQTELSAMTFVMQIGSLPGACYTPLGDIFWRAATNTRYGYAHGMVSVSWCPNVTDFPGAETDCDAVARTAGDGARERPEKESGVRVYLFRAPE